MDGQGQQGDGGGERRVAQDELRERSDDGKDRIEIDRYVDREQDIKIRKRKKWKNKKKKRKKRKKKKKKRRRRRRRATSCARRTERDQTMEVTEMR